MLKGLVYWSLLTTISAGKYCLNLYTGTEFLVMAPIVLQRNHEPEFCQLFAYGDENTTVTVQTRSPSMNETKCIGSDGLATFNLTYDQVSMNTTGNARTLQEKGILVTSSRPIGVMVHVNGSDGYSAVPRNEDRKAVLRNEDRMYVASSLSADKCMSHIAISAFEDETKVKTVVRISKNKEIQFNGKEYKDGDDITFELDAFQIRVVYGEGDLSGSSIKSGKDISVFSGIVCEPEHGSGFLEQLLPIDKFGKRHLVFPLGDFVTKIFTFPDYKAIALHANTTVNISRQSDVKYLDKVGDFMKLNGTGYIADKAMMHVQILQTNKPVDNWHICHFVHTTLVPYRCRWTSHRFIALSDYTTTLVMTMAKEDNLTDLDVKLDEKDLKDVAKFYYLHTQMLALVPEVSSGPHTVTSPGGKLMAVYVYGTADHSVVSFHAASWEKPVEVNTSSSLTGPLASDPPSSPVSVYSDQSADKLDTSVATAPTSIRLAPTTTTTLTSTLERLASSTLLSTLKSTSAATMLTSSRSSSTVSSTSPTTMLTFSRSSSAMKSTSATTMLTSARSSSTMASTLSTTMLTSSLIMTSTTTTTTTKLTTTTTTITTTPTTTTTTTSTLESATQSAPSRSKTSICRCACAFQPPVKIPLLPVAKGSTGKHKRKLTSAPDHRPTATGFGVIGILMIAIPFVGILLADLRRIVKHMSSVVAIQL